MELHATSITLKNCARTFPDGTVGLHPLDLQIAAGETLVLLGPSGCGKTTTLRMIAGLEPCDKGGQIYFADEEVTHIGIEKRDIGIVFQSYALFPNMNVIKNIAYGLKFRNISKAEKQARLDEILTMMDLTELAERPIDALSGGQRQRVALARALVIQPRVLLFDEPLSALDALLKVRLREEIANLLKSLGITAVYVTHDQEEAMVVGDRIAVLNKGKVEQIANPETLYQHPETDFVANFIGNINQLKGQMQNGQFHPDANGENIYIRPEKVLLSATSEGLQGVVRSQFYLGSSRRFLIDIGNEALLMADVPTENNFPVGATVGIAFMPDSLFTLA